MARRGEYARKGEVGGRFATMLPLFIMTVCVVFSFVFTVLTVPLGPITWDIKFVFILMLVVTTTVASAVAIMFYVFMLGKGSSGRRRRR